MKILIINNNSIHINQIHKLFPIDSIFTYISYQQIWWYNTSDFDCIVLTWSSTHTYAYKAFSQEIDLIRETTKPIIGICLGCELIVSSFCGVIVKGSTRIEWDLNLVCKDDPLPHKVHEAHKFCIVNLWEELEWIWKSNYGYEIVKHKTKPILGFQFHPEVDTPSNDWLMLFKKYFEKLWIWKI